MWLSSSVTNSFSLGPVVKPPEDDINLPGRRSLPTRITPFIYPDNAVHHPDVAVHLPG